MQKLYLSVARVLLGQHIVQSCLLQEKVCEDGRIDNLLLIETSEDTDASTVAYVHDKRVDIIRGPDAKEIARVLQPRLDLLV